MDTQGWISIPLVVDATDRWRKAQAKAAAKGLAPPADYGIGDLIAEVKGQDKVRFELDALDASARFIRALQGHSDEVATKRELDIQPVIDEEVALSMREHGMFIAKHATDATDDILKCGYLDPMGRKHVHLAHAGYPPREGKSHTFEIDVLALVRSRTVVVYRAANGCLLADGRVSLEYVTRVVENRAGEVVWPPAAPVVV